MKVLAGSSSGTGDYSRLEVVATGKWGGWCICRRVNFLILKAVATSLKMHIIVPSNIQTKKLNRS